MPKFKIYPALREDMNEGWVWLGGYNHLPNRSIIKITNCKNSKYSFCEICKIEDKKDDKEGNFVRRYNRKCGGRIPIKDEKSALVISAWYRGKLGITEEKKEKHAELEIDIEPEPYGYLGKICACLHHPQNVVRVGTWLGIIGVALGVLAFFMTDPVKNIVVNFFKSFSCH